MTLAVLSQVSCAERLPQNLKSPPVVEAVCFSPDEKCDQKLLDFIKTAKESVDIAIYDINLATLVQQLLVMNKSISMRIVVDNRQSKGPHSLVLTLVRAGANVRMGHQRGIMHNKFVIVDGKRLETGSFNYTNHASQANQENQIYTESLPVVARYKERFEKIWESAIPIQEKDNSESK